MFFLENCIIETISGVLLNKYSDVVFHIRIQARYCFT